MNTSAVERVCVTGANPDGLPLVPPDASFIHDYMQAPDLEEIGEALIHSRPDIEEAANARIRYMWRQKHGLSSGNAVLGKCQKLSGAAKIAANCEYIIFAAADLVRETEMKNFELEALIYHELRHVKVEFSDDGVPSFKVRGHDVEMFRSEVSGYGLWRPNLAAAAETFRQLSLLTKGGDDLSVQDRIDAMHRMGSRIYDANGVEIETAESLNSHVEKVFSNLIGDRPFKDVVHEHLVEHNIPFEEGVSVPRTRRDAADIVQSTVRKSFNKLLSDEVELDPDVTPHASGLIPDAVSPAIEVERTLKAAGIPVRYDADSGLYRNPNGDAYPERWAEQEAGIQARSMGFRTSQ